MARDDGAGAAAAGPASASPGPGAGGAADPRGRGSSPGHGQPPKGAAPAQDDDRWSDDRVGSPTPQATGLPRRRYGSLGWWRSPGRGGRPPPGRTAGPHGRAGLDVVLVGRGGQPARARRWASPGRVACAAAVPRRGRGQRRGRGDRGVRRPVPGDAQERVDRPAVAAPPAGRPAGGAAAPGVNLPVPGISPFITPNGQFYRIDTALLVPQVDPSNWTLRIHGMVAREVTITFDQLLRCR